MNSLGTSRTLDFINSYRGSLQILFTKFCLKSTEFTLKNFYQILFKLS